MNIVLSALAEMNKLKSKEDQYNAIKSILIQRHLLFPLDILLIGATGVGKSSTINAIFGNLVATIGDGCDPETQGCDGYKVGDYFRIFDTPGLGDGIMEDERHIQSITNLLRKRCAHPSESNGLIDLVLIIIDGGSRDLGTTYKLIETVMHNIGPARVIVAINQSDMAMKGRNWNEDHCMPEKTLLDFLEEKAESIRLRIFESTGLSITRPVCYSACNDWNIDELVNHIIDHIPFSRRVL